MGRKQKEYLSKINWKRLAGWFIGVFGVNGLWYLSPLSTRYPEANLWLAFISTAVTLMVSPQHKEKSSKKGNKQ